MSPFLKLENNLILSKLFIDSGLLFNFSFNNFLTPGDLIGLGNSKFFTILLFSVWFSLMG
jgi:hypothetical protein